jgi:hypothetical protein|tara:strand:+ start:27 stop:1154 length:1128 start_codon:yes stop_codon:yes gene_type:complete
MRISAVMGIILCSCLAYIACGSDDDGGQNPVAADGDINSGAALGTDGDGNNAETPNTDSDADNTETPDADGIVDITGAFFTNFAANCATYANCYVSLVVDVQNGSSFAGNLKITVDGDKCLFASNAIPNHDFNASGNFATLASAQEVSYEISAIPTTAASVTYLVLGDDAVFLNGVKLDLLAAACYDVGSEPLGRENIGCGPDQNDNPWRYDPMSPLNNFGTDEHNAHTQPDGTYHYHGNPMAMFETDCATGTASPVIGFAADGFPIYGTCFDDNGTVRKVLPSYQLKMGGGAREDVSGYTTPVGGRGSVASSNYDGQFRGDYEYVGGSGDLDGCNGMMVNGQYGYFVTDAYPWVLGCYSGTPDGSFSMAMGPPR